MQPSAEPVRLVIWDLDETFWSGTLTEGGITYRRDCHDIVQALARRGIVSSICSKNDHAAARDILVRENIWDSFVFASIDWQPKGPRLAALVAAMQLRAPTILFIDDNAGNRAEAQHFVPGIQVADEAIIPTLLDNPLLHGKDDNGLTRLAHYQVLARRQADERAASIGGDTLGFLRGSNIRVSIELDLEAHLDRAIELINRTNQLNFTKARLPEDIGAARTELRLLLSGYRTQAGIIHVRDNYGDYGYCGIYVMLAGNKNRLVHFCFSCRILNMGVESWLYQRLGRPELRIRGEVLGNVARDRRTIDWITAELPWAGDGGGETAQLLDYVYARGGCDLNAITHYFNIMARDVHREVSFVRAGANMRFDHSIFARYAVEGISDEARQAFARLGYLDGDYTTRLTGFPHEARGVWLLSFGADAGCALYRHRATGQSVPVSMATIKPGFNDLTKIDPAAPEYAAEQAMIRVLQDEFEFTGMIAEPDFKANLRLILQRAWPGTRVFILLANEHVDRDGKILVSTKKHALNSWMREVARDFACVTLVDITSLFKDEPEVLTGNHFDRMVYFRIFQYILGLIRDDVASHGTTSHGTTSPGTTSHGTTSPGTANQEATIEGAARQVVASPARDKPAHSFASMTTGEEE